MDPLRRTGGRDDEPRSHLVDPGYCKYYPGTAPTPYPSKITRTYPAPTLLAQRQQQQQQQQQQHNALANEDTNVSASNNNSDGDSNDCESNDPNSLDNNNQDAGAAATATDNAVNAAHPRTKRKNPEKVDDKARCPICQDLLPEENRGIVKCGHVFCLKCVLQWVKKQQNSCPTCRAKVCHIKKTLSLAEALEKNANRKPLTKAQLKRTKRKSTIGKPFPKPDITTEKIRVHKKVSREQIRQNAMAPHPQAPGGFLHAQEQAEAAAEAAQAVPDAQPDQVEAIVDQQVAIAVFSSSPPPPPATPQVPSPLPPSSPRSLATDLEDRRVAIEADRRALLESTSAFRGHRSVGGGSYVGGAGGARSIGDSGGGVGDRVGEASLDVRVENNSGGGGGGGGGAVGGRGWRSTVNIGNSSSGVSSDGGGDGSGNSDADNSNSRNNAGVRTGGAAEAAAQESSSNRDVQGAATSSGGDNLDHDDDDDDGTGDGVGNITTLGHLLSVLGSRRIRVSPNGGIGGIDDGGGGGGIAAAAPSSVPCSPLLPSYSRRSNNNKSISNSSHGVGNPATDPETRSAAQAAMAVSRAASRYTSLVPEQALAVQGLAALESSPTLRQLRAVARLVVGGSASAGMAGAPALASVSRRRQPQDGLGQESRQDRDDEAGVFGRRDGGKSNGEERGNLLPRIDNDDNRSDNISSRGGGNGSEEEPCVEPASRRTAVGERDVSHTEERDEFAFPGRNDNDTTAHLPLTGSSRQGGTTGSASPILSDSSATVACGSSTSIPESFAHTSGNDAAPSGSINDGANTAVAGAEDACGGDADGAGVAGSDHAGGGISVSANGAAGPGGVAINSGRVHSSPLSSNNNNNNNNTCSYLTWLESRSDFNHWPSPSSDDDDNAASD